MNKKNRMGYEIKSNQNIVRYETKKPTIDPARMDNQIKNHPDFLLLANKKNRRLSITVGNINIFFHSKQTLLNESRIYEKNPTSKKKTADTMKHTKKISELSFFLFFAKINLQS